MPGNPYDFDVARQHNDHVTVGKGSPHLCLGNLLARIETLARQAGGGYAHGPTSLAGRRSGLA